MFIRSFSWGASDSRVNVVDDKSWWHIDSIMCLLLEHHRANRSLIGSITHTSANKQGLAGKNIQKVAMIHPGAHHSTALDSIAAFLLRRM